MSARKAWVVCGTAAMLAWAIGATAAPKLTTIEDTLYKADGAKFEGLVIISWRSFEAADTANVAAHVKTVRVVNGYLRVQLVPSTDAVPGFQYAVRYNSNGKIQWEEIWVVPPSVHPLRVRDVRLTNGETGTPAPEPLTEADIVGLEQDLAARPVKGPAYLPNSVARINSQGELESVQGGAGDCVRVDGSSGPCDTATPPGGPGFTDGETPSGAVDGANDAFLLAAAPDPASSLVLLRNGLLLKHSLDFVLSGSTITFTAAVPVPGDVLSASYRTAPTGSAPFFADAEEPAGAIDGANATFTLAHAPNPVSSLAVYRNGVRAKLNDDYAVNGQSVQFVTGAIPQPGDILLVYYRY